VPQWIWWLVIGAAAWGVLAMLAAVFVGRTLALAGREPETPAADARPPAPPSPMVVTDLAAEDDRLRILVVDDDHGLRTLLRTTLSASEFALQEAESAEVAADIARFWSPDVAIVDVALPGVDGLALARKLKASARAEVAPNVIVLTGSDAKTEEIVAAGADAVLRKPFSPLELIAMVDGLDVSSPPLPDEVGTSDAEQLLMYARDLGRILRVERNQRRVLQQAYRQTAVALAEALEAKDPGTGRHAVRVQHYALELATAMGDDPAIHDASLEYGFLLHDVGKIGIPESVLLKEGPLDAGERHIMQQHTRFGEQILAGIPLLHGAALSVVRSHHERWDGTGYPDRLAGGQIPMPARIFAVADTLDAITSDRPYRRARPWEDAVDEILLHSGTQFDPRVVRAFALRESQLRELSRDLADIAA
jgi:response regulator RpfG family c-di-GMP phosphodiesterase